MSEFEKEEKIPVAIFEGYLKLLAPLAPHITDELWHELGHNTFIYNEAWPTYDESKISSEMMTIGVQVNGKLRATFEVARNGSEESIKEYAMTIPEVSKWTDGKEVKKIIYVKGKLVSIVV